MSCESIGKHPCSMHLVLGVQQMRINSKASLVNNNLYRPLLYTNRRHRMTERNHQKVQVAEEKVRLERDTELRADISLRESARTCHVVIGTLQCVSITSLNQDANIPRMPIPTR